MDWSQFDPEGAARQRFFEIDDMVEQIDDLVRFSDWTKDELVNTLDVMVTPRNGLEGVVYAYPEIQRVSLREVSDTSLMSTCRTLRVQKAAVDFFRELAAADGKVTVTMLEKLNGDLLNNEEMAAVYRKDIPIHRTYFHDIAQPEDIRGGLDDLLTWVNSREARELHIIELASKAHHWFMHVFPFPAEWICGQALSQLRARARRLPWGSYTRLRPPEVLRGVGTQLDFRTSSVTPWRAAWEHSSPSPIIRWRASRPSCTCSRDSPETSRCWPS